MALNGWRIMWIFAVFDLPTQTKEQRHAYTQFRQTLLKNGFSQLQYSVYIRNMPTFHKAEALVEQLGRETPAEGVCAFLFFLKISQAKKKTKVKLNQQFTSLLKCIKF